MTQTATRADIVVVGAPDADALTSSLMAALRRNGFPFADDPDPGTDSLHRHQASGKLERFIPL